MKKFIYAKTEEYTTYGLYKGYCNKINVDRIIYMFHYPHIDGEEKYVVVVDMGKGNLEMWVSEETYRELENMEYE